jgi:hypothetical protein
MVFGIHDDRVHGDICAARARSTLPHFSFLHEQISGQ